MAQQTGISWTDATWNPWHGCRKVSQGCKYCYMFRDKERWKQDPTVVRRSNANFNAPYDWSFEMQMVGQNGKEKSNAFPGMKIFTCSWSDFFIEEADEWRPEAWKIIKDTPEFTYQILTKRPERIADHLPADWGSGYPNVWLGVSAEDQGNYYHRIPILARIPAKIRFISFEPLLGPIEIADNDHDLESFHWVIIGGESGNNEGKYLYRECRLEWINALVKAFHYTHDIRVWVKQLGTHLAKGWADTDRHGTIIPKALSYMNLQEFPIVEKDGGYEVQVSPPSNAVAIPLPSNPTIIDMSAFNIEETEDPYL